MRTCPFDGCSIQIPDGRFACGPHWYSLNKDQQNRIWAAYKCYQQGKINLRALRLLQAQVIYEAQGQQSS